MPHAPPLAPPPSPLPPPPVLRGPAGADAGRHRALLLSKAQGLQRLGDRPGLAERVLERLLAPAAQIEGVDFHLGDPRLAVAAARAGAFALVLPPLGNLSTPFYSVHPRRNDRFLCARPPLKALFPEVDFAAFSFTGHALATLATLCPERFAEVRRVLVRDWCTRVRLLLDLLPVRGVLIDLPAPAWLRRPAIPGEGLRRLVLDPAPAARPQAVAALRGAAAAGPANGKRPAGEGGPLQDSRAGGIRACPSAPARR